MKHQEPEKDVPDQTDSADSPTGDRLESARRLARRRLDSGQITKDEFDKQIALINDVSPN